MQDLRIKDVELMLMYEIPGDQPDHHAYGLAHGTLLRPTPGAFMKAIVYPVANERPRVDVVTVGRTSRDGRIGSRDRAEIYTDANDFEGTGYELHNPWGYVPEYIREVARAAEQAYERLMADPAR